MCILCASISGMIECVFGYKGLKNSRDKTVLENIDTDIIITVFILKNKLWLFHTTTTAINVATFVLTKITSDHEFFKILS